MTEAAALDEQNVWHIVNNWQDIKARIGMKFRPICGVQVTLKADAQYPTDDAPTCPKCAAIAGW